MRRDVGAAQRAVRRPGRLLAMLIALVPLTAGCGVLGGLSQRGLRAPGVMTVTSPAFSADVGLPLQYTCRGAGLSPPLQWSGAPGQRVKSFAIVIDDSEAPISPYVYWIAFNISRNSIAIPQNGLPPHALQAQNSLGQARYDPPCPQGGPHRYRFTVYALNVSRLPGPNGPLGPGAGLAQTWRAIAAHVIAVGRLTASATP